MMSSKERSSADCISVEYEGKFSYYIYLRQDFLDLKEELIRLECEGRRICIVTDSNVGPLYEEALKSAIAGVASKITVFTFKAGEEQKNLSTVEQLYEHLILESFDRKDVLIALGGGVVGDLTGFTAATYLRGIRFIQVPTSLLAMVDSSIGGKTGVDFKSYKNMVGAFYMPKCVYMNLSCLLTLDDRQFYAGFGEIIKHGLIKDKNYYEWLKQHREAILHKDFNSLKETVYRSCMIKRDVVQRDPKEKGERALLNFGHTLGHAVEKQMLFEKLHGECVSIGMAAASFLSFKRGDITREEYEDIKTVLKVYSLPVTVKNCNKEEILSAASHDKKMDGKKIKFILLKQIGEAVIDTTVSQEEMKHALDSLEETE
ncbi:MAG: 3-dehydroquinate synthase [Lachnospiraceae bacterium]|nr:3-dehydroquinate synthase [Lachnospiraceae bacterium]